jgi:hypothetical protein
MARFMRSSKARRVAKRQGIVRVLYSNLSLQRGPLAGRSVPSSAFSWRCLPFGKFHIFLSNVGQDLLTDFPARIPFESFSGLSPTLVDPNAFGVGRDPAWGRRRGEVQWVERPAVGECQRGDK